MPFFHIGRQRTVTETYLVEASSEAEARAIANDEDRLRQERLMNLDMGSPIQGSVVVMPYNGLNCEQGEQVFDVEVEERHDQSVLVVAQDKNDAIQKVLQGEGDFLHKTKYSETSESSQWTVRDLKGEWVG